MSMTENEAIDLDKLIEDAKVLAKEKDTLARTFRNFKDYGNPKSTITSGAEKAQKEAEQYEHISKLFEELKAYRAIGTIEEFKALKEKSIAKKPDYEGDGCWDGHVVIDTWICPNCEKHYEVDYDDYDYCPDCGQRIDHSGLTEDD